MDGTMSGRAIPHRFHIPLLLTAVDSVCLQITPKQQRQREGSVRKGVCRRSPRNKRRLCTHACPLRRKGYSAER